jgi:hypothetical protein
MPNDHFGVRRLIMRIWFFALAGALAILLGILSMKIMMG